MSDGRRKPTKAPPKKQPPSDYEVGYCRPPKHTRWKPGQSGNPGKGRPKGTRNFKTDLTAVLKQPVQVTRDGAKRKVSTQEAMLLRLREKALNGDARARPTSRARPTLRRRADRAGGRARGRGRRDLCAVRARPDQADGAARG